MTQQAQGVVSRILTKQVGARNSTVYTIRLNGDDNYYNCNFDKPPCKEGDEVRFQFEVDNYGKKVQVKSMKVREGTAPVDHAAPKAKAVGGGNSRDDYWANKDKRDIEVTQPLIMYQSATQVAKDLGIAALNAGILPTAGSKKADKFDSFLDIVREVRDEVFGEYMAAYKTLQEGGDILEEEDLPAVAPIEQEAVPAAPAGDATPATTDDWGDLESDDWN